MKGDGDDCYTVALRFFDTFPAANFRRETLKRVLVLMTTLFAGSALAGEGMWMPQQIPQLAAELKQAGIKIDPKRLADLTGDPMGAVISLGGCSASFVSPEGLVVTNHHCAYTSIQQNSTADNDLLTNGFLAKTRADELQAAPGSRVFVTTKIEDVTDRVVGKLGSKLGDAERARAIIRHERELIDECEKPGGLRCRVASFFEGSQYLRITQMEIRDVRLVYAPAEGVGNFGGETDNWMWPRHTGDFSFYRAYVGADGKPADYSPDNVPFRPVHWLKVSTEGVTEGDLVIVAGYPGYTSRYRTAAEIRNSQEYSLPTTIRFATELNRILNEVGKDDREIQLRNASRIKGNDNVLKNYEGTVAKMNRGTIARHRTEREAGLAKWIAADPERTRKYGMVMGRIAALNVEQYSTRQRDSVLSWIYRSSPMLTQAQKVYRWSIEKTRNDLDRAEGYRERDVPLLMQASTRAQRTFDLASDRAGLRWFLMEATKLPAGQRIVALDQELAATGASTPEAQVEKLLDRIYSSTQINDAKVRKVMYSESKAQLEARDDSMIEFVAALFPTTLVDEEREKRLWGAMSRVRPLYLQALREMTGGRLYPDANSTLRITFGTVKGYSPRDAVDYEPQTKLSGIVAKTTGEGEFVSPAGLLAAAKENKTAGYVDRQLGEVPVNFLSTVDTTGGNSGSPTLNAKGELAGLLFDGNYEALGSDYLVEEEITRSIHVDAVYMLWVMDAVDGAHHLLREMGVTPKFAK